MRFFAEVIREFFGLIVYVAIIGALFLLGSHFVQEALSHVALGR